MNFMPYKANECLENTFYQIPKELFINLAYTKLSSDSKLLKRSHFYRLYVHYLYVFGKLPAKTHYEERSAEYYKAIEKMDQIT